VTRVGSRIFFFKKKHFGYRFFYKKTFLTVGAPILTTFFAIACYNMKKCQKNNKKQDLGRLFSVLESFFWYQIPLWFRFFQNFENRKNCTRTAIRFSWKRAKFHFFFWVFFGFFRKKKIFFFFFFRKKKKVKKVKKTTFLFFFRKTSRLHLYRHKKTAKKSDKGLQPQFVTTFKKKHKKKKVIFPIFKSRGDLEIRFFPVFSKRTHIFTLWRHGFFRFFSVFSKNPSTGRLYQLLFSENEQTPPLYDIFRVFFHFFSFFCVFFNIAPKSSVFWIS